MNEVSPLIQYDKVLKQYTVDIIEDGENETLIFSDPQAAAKAVSEYRAKGYEDMKIW